MSVFAIKTLLTSYEINYFLTFVPGNFLTVTEILLAIRLL